jgi:TonB family protein
MSVRPAVLSVLVALCCTGAPLLHAQEEPLEAGSDGVPAPKKTRQVLPVYPPEALAQGIRGIVILEVVVGKTGRVENVTVVRSIPGLDEAAVTAARQWEYQPVKVDGKPVSVRMTVPVTFALALPTIERQAGIPELRQGVSPAWPTEARGGGRAAAEVTLEPDGRIGIARVVEGVEPWSQALLAALKTWRFSAPPDDAVLSFRVEVEFQEGRGGDSRQVRLRATGLQRADLMAAPEPQAPPTAVAEAAPSASTPTAAAPEPEPEAAQPPATAPPPPEEPAASAAPQGASAPAVPPPPSEAPQEPPPSPPAPSVPAPPAPAGSPSGTAAEPAVGAPASAPPGAAVPPAATAGSGPAAAPASPVAGSSGPTADGTAPPPVEVITAPPPPSPPENGVSAIRDVTLDPGVPDLARGRRPVVPPFARMGGVEGAVEVQFSVGAGGTTTVRSVEGPDLLKPAAQQAVESWLFRRTRADRAYLLAVFTYVADKATAVVRPQPAPDSAPHPAATVASEPPPGAPPPAPPPDGH